MSCLCSVRLRASAGNGRLCWFKPPSDSGIIDFWSGSLRVLRLELSSLGLLQCLLLCSCLPVPALLTALYIKKSHLILFPAAKAQARDVRCFENRIGLAHLHGNDINLFLQLLFLQEVESALEASNGCLDRVLRSQQLAALVALDWSLPVLLAKEGPLRQLLRLEGRQVFHLAVPERLEGKLGWLPTEMLVCMLKLGEDWRLLSK